MDVELRETCDLNSMKQYSFATQDVPRLSAADSKVDQLIKDGQPVVVTDSGLVESGLKWDLSYLHENIGSGKNNVFLSDTDQFKFYEESRIAKWKDFKPPTEKIEASFSEFVEMLKNAKCTGKKLYLQQILNSTVGKNMVADFVSFNWAWANKYKQMKKWGPLSSNLLLVGMEGNITPVHYDEQENFFGQLVGYKRIMLFSPDQFHCLYPHPVSHPCDRQSQVDIDDPDLKKFPNFSQLCGYQCIVKPGDVLYIPMYWWHYVESLHTAVESNEVCNVNVSVNFWYKAPSMAPQISYPITAQQKVSVMRNIEKMLGEVLKEPTEVGNLLCTLTEGRYT